MPDKKYIQILIAVILLFTIVILFKILFKNSILFLSLKNTYHLSKVILHCRRHVHLQAVQAEKTFHCAKWH